MPDGLEADVESTEQELQAQGNRATGQAAAVPPARRAERPPEGSATRATADSRAPGAPAPSQLEEIEAFVNLGRWAWDVSTGAITCSPQLIRIFGLASPDLMPDSDSFLLRVHQSDRTRVRASIMRSLATGEPFQFQHRVVRMDDEVRVLRTRGGVERSEDGRPLRILGISQDISDVHAADKRAQVRFMQVARRALDREERDRNQIVKELRERVSEPLIALGKKLATINATGPAAEVAPVAAQLDDCIHSVNSVGASALQVMGHLRPSVLEEHGLLAALRAEAMRVGRQAAIPVREMRISVQPAWRAEFAMASCARRKSAVSTPIGSRGEISSAETLTGIAAWRPTRIASARSAASRPCSSSTLGRRCPITCRAAAPTELTE